MNFWGLFGYKMMNPLKEFFRMIAIFTALNILFANDHLGGNFVGVNTVTSAGIFGLVAINSHLEGNVLKQFSVSRKINFLLDFLRLVSCAVLLTVLGWLLTSIPFLNWGYFGDSMTDSFFRLLVVGSFGLSIGYLSLEIKKSVLGYIGLGILLIFSLPVLLFTFVPWIMIFTEGAWWTGSSSQFSWAPSHSSNIYYLGLLFIGFNIGLAKILSMRPARL